ncbi:MAG: Gfo/Idh/MocA family oxidoreductase, partial [Oscillospiraceae bacterium]
MNVAIIGTGMIADVHAQALTELGHKLTIVINRKNKNSAESFSKKWNIESFSDSLDDAFKDNIDFVHVCTLPVFHYEEVKAALNNNKNVICEKPLCLEADQAFELVELAKSKNLINAVCFNVRFYNGCSEIKKNLKGKEFGEPFLVHGKYMQEFHALPCEYSWRYIDSVAGKMRATTEIGSHWIDLLRYLTELEVKSVSARFGKIAPNRKIENNIMQFADESAGNTIDVSSEDVAIINFELSNGGIANVVLSEVSHGRNNKVEIEITGKNKSVWWDSEHPYQVNTALKNQGVTTNTNAFTDGFSSTFKELFANVYQGKSEVNYPTFYDG